MSTAAVLVVLAAFAQVCLTLFAVARLGLGRVAHVKSGALKLKDIALNDQLWPDEIKARQNNLSNLCETPVLFFAGVAIALAAGAAGWAVAVCAWTFVAARIVHHMIHVGSNHVLKRFNAFLASLAAIAALWLSLVIGVVI